MLKRRLIENKLAQLFKDFPVVAVLGPRQVGKSTLLHELFLPSADHITFDPILDIENAKQDPDLFLKSHSTPLILDEIQYAPEIVPALKRRIDQDRKSSQYLITGSQQWEVMKNLSESLAGRVVFLELEGFTLAESMEVASQGLWLSDYLDDPKGFLNSKLKRLENPLSPFEDLWRGWYPEAKTISLSSIPAFYQAYQRTYLDRDVRLFHEISDLTLFQRFLGYCAALSAQEINYTQYGRELEIDPKTAKSWLSILRSTFQWFEVPAFSANAVKRISGKPKGYLSDTGLICALQYLSSPQALAGHPLFGAVFETGVVQEIRKQNNALHAPAKLFHWRSHGGAEVDLILERDGKLFPIEIKGKTHPSKRDISGLKAFRETYPRHSIQPALIISFSETVYPLSENIWTLPWDVIKPA
jgi:uncharacterized protein